MIKLVVATRLSKSVCERCPEREFSERCPERSHLIVWQAQRSVTRQFSLVPLRNACYSFFAYFHVNGEMRGVA